VVPDSLVLQPADGLHRRVCRPWRVRRREPGSPIIALEAAKNHCANIKGELVFWFVEEDADRAAHLESRIDAMQLPAHIDVNIAKGTFAEDLTDILDGLDEENGRLAPTFALIDPFGFSGIPYAIIRR
jgi:three-Cys-motif partner protein